jgi:thymidylate kinase
MSTERAPRLTSLPRRPPMRRRPGRGVLVTLSGMDGAGKSSAALAIGERLQDAGIPVKHEWQRLGDMRSLKLVAKPFKRVLPMRRGVAGSPVAGYERMRGPVAWVWVVIVALETARAHMISTGIATWGVGVVADRWLTDSLVDLEVRYGRHRLAEWILRALAPRSDLDILLEIDAATSVRRKPEDRPVPVLERMEGSYARVAELTGVRRIDATRPHDEVMAELMGLVDELIATRGLSRSGAAAAG